MWGACVLTPLIHQLEFMYSEKLSPFIYKLSKTVSMGKVSVGPSHSEYLLRGICMHNLDTNQEENVEMIMYTYSPE